MKRLTGATLVRCQFCRAERVLLVWIAGRGWCCPTCETSVEGKNHG